MSVGIDDTFNSFLFRQWPPAPVEIEPFRRRIEFDPGAGARRGVENGGDVNLVRLALQKQATSRMRQNSDEPILHRANHARGHVRFAQIKNGMDGRDYVVELRQNVVWKIERAFAQNVAFNPSKQAKAIELFVQLSNRCNLCAQLRLIDSMRLNRAAAVIGNAEILQAQRLSGFGHFFERVVAVARD